MEMAHNLVLNDEALRALPANKRDVFVFEWLQFLDKVLGALKRADIKDHQEKITRQLLEHLTKTPGPPTRYLIAKCLCTLFTIGETSMLFSTVDKCTEIIKNKDDSLSYLPNKLAAITCIGVLYQGMGRMVGKAYEDTVHLLIRSLKSAESQGRQEVMLTLERMVTGLGSVATNVHKEIYRVTSKQLTDRSSMYIRTAASKCMLALWTESLYLRQHELENIVTLSLRALDGSNYDVRIHIAVLLSRILADAVKPPPANTRNRNSGPPMKVHSTQEALSLLASGFVKAGRASAALEMVRGASAVNREIRVGVTHAYIEFIKLMGPQWLERNMALFINHIASLAANPKTTPTHIDAVYARKCLVFIMSSVIQGILGEKAQVNAAKELGKIIKREMDIMSAESHTDSPQQSVIFATQHVLVCCLQELGSILINLATTANQLVIDNSQDVLDPVMSALTHAAPAARLAAAWCLRSIVIAVPSLLTRHLETCMAQLDKLKGQSDALTGYSFAITALLGAVSKCPLGIPSSIGKKVFTLAEDLLRSAPQSSRLSLPRVQSGWLVVSALVSLGSASVKSYLPSLLALWRNVFPRSAKELEDESRRGDAFTWQVALEGRAGALRSLHSFITSCRELVTADTTKRILVPIECAFLLLQQIPQIVKDHGSHLKACAAMLRLRLYDVLYALPPRSYETAYKSLFRELVAEFTLTENPGNTSSSLLRSLCHEDDSVILGSWLQETDHKPIEDQLQPNSAAGSGTLEHDSAHLFSTNNSIDPGALPLGVAVVDASVRLFGVLFPRVSEKHKLQMLNHFRECIKQARNQRQEAIQINIFTAVLSALKGCADRKQEFGSPEVRQASLVLIMDMLASPSPLLRCAAGEALGRMTQCTSDRNFQSDMVQRSFDKLKSARDVVSRTGHSLSLGCLHRYSGGMGSGQHLSASVSILLALAKDYSAPVVQVWSLHALGLIADTGGPMFRSYVEVALNLVLNCLLTVPKSHTDVHQCLGKCLSALITNLGPELQGTSRSITDARLCCLVSCDIMKEHPDSLVQAQAISCLQQLHLFAPRHVNLSTLVPRLCSCLASGQLLLRRAAVACLRQLAQREASEVSEYARQLYESDLSPLTNDDATAEGGLEGALFSLLDRETDERLRKDVGDTLIGMLQTLAGTNLTHWFKLVRNVLSAATDTESGETSGEISGEPEDPDSVDDDEQFKGVKEQKSRAHLAPKWPTRVFAVECMMKIMQECKTDRAHLDLALAQELRDKKAGGRDYLVLHLSELVRVAFIAATSDSDKLRLGGLELLEDVITTYCAVREPEFPDHVVLEQYQAQVSSALRPAFGSDTPSDVTSAACRVCSTWIKSGVARDLNDLRRVHQLLSTSLDKLKQDGRANKMAVYNETAATMEKLAVLNAWAEVYIEAQRREFSSSTCGSESLLDLVRPELSFLARLWIATLRDTALLSLPTNQIPSQGGAFFSVDSVDVVRPVYKSTWTSCLLAAAYFLKHEGFDTTLGDSEKGVSSMTGSGMSVVMEMNETDRFYLLLGVAMEALSARTSDAPDSTVISCLQAVETILRADKSVSVSPALSREILAVLHRLLLTRDHPEIRILSASVLEQLVASAKLNTDCEDSLVSENSLVFSCLEVCLGVAIRYVPALHIANNQSDGSASTFNQSRNNKLKMDQSMGSVLTAVLQVITQLPGLCSDEGRRQLMPILLYLVTRTLKQLSETAAVPGAASTVTATATALQTLTSLCSASSFSKDGKYGEDDILLLQSTILYLLGSAVQPQTLVLSLAVIIQACPVQATANQFISDKVSQVLADMWQDDTEGKLRVAIAQLCATTFNHSTIEVSHCYIRLLSPVIYQYVRSGGENSDTKLFQQCVGLLELCITKASQQHRSPILCATCCLLAAHLLNSELEFSNATAQRKELHSTALNLLLGIAAKETFSTDFKNLLQTSSPLKTRLESAIKLSQAQAAANQRNKEKMNKDREQSSKPAIKLTMDFKGFK